MIGVTGSDCELGMGGMSRSSCNGAIGAIVRGNADSMSPEGELAALAELCSWGLRTA